MEKIEVKLEKDNNDFFREWIIKEWQHHNTVDPIYQLRIIKPEELKFKKMKNIIKSYITIRWLDSLELKIMKKKYIYIDFL